ncbi:formyltetrahydrofolate deformylase 1 [Quercus suber]|uniref:Formyltetrahydrofolate deformylase 1 n=1 Tax=Quercus suber TaxID=58331 RepID=A0AAW0L9Y6_QUESU
MVLVGERGSGTWAWVFSPVNRKREEVSLLALAVVRERERERENELDTKSFNKLPQVIGFGNRSFKSLRFPGQSLDSSSSSVLTHGIHVFQCPDAVGIVAKLSDCIASKGATYSALMFSYPKTSDQFIFDPVKWPREQMDEDFNNLSKMFNAMRSLSGCPTKTPNIKLPSLLQNRTIAWLICCMDGRTEGYHNHDRGSNTHVIRFLERHGIPYHYLRTTKENKREGDILELVPNTDFLVLARYMQILSGNFLRSYGKDVINIHHGLLPSFKGGIHLDRMCWQAFVAGVKLIGATSHFVTEELDAGPIIEQMVERVSHRDNLLSFVQKSENLEKQCLAKAIKSYCELRVLPYEGKKTVVF